MAASTLTTTTFNNSSDANFRAWGSAFDAAILAGGWTDNGDSGQINFATVLAPVAANTSQGYKIYKSPNEGGLSNFYLKLEFGSANAGATCPAVWITFGFQGTDGAGNMLSTINPISTRKQCGTAVLPTGNSLNINFATGTGYICICEVGVVNANETLWFCVERTKDSNLAFMDQLNIFGNALSGSSNSAYCQVINKLNAFPTVSGGLNINLNVGIPANASSPVAGVVGLGLCFGFGVGPISPSINLFFVESTVLGITGDVVTVPILGVNHNYKLQGGYQLAGQATTVIMSRYE